MIYEYRNNSNLNKARENNNDEYYTQLCDIEKELSHYLDKFKDKVVYCNCDNPKNSKFWEYFHKHFSVLGLKRLTATFYSENAFCAEYYGGNDEDINCYDTRSISGNGDFRGRECVEILKESDVVVTNPPFSLFVSFVNLLIDNHKQFLIIGNKNAITYSDFSELIVNNKIWIGYEYPAEFDTPNGTTKSIRGLSYWFTNIDIDKRHKEIELSCQYTPDKYPKYDNYDAINVNKIKEIPKDYMGIMGVPITFLKQYNPNQFEILGITKRKNDPYRIKVYTSEIGRQFYILNSSPVILESGKYKPLYSRILIRRII